MTSSKQDGFSQETNLGYLLLRSARFYTEICVARFQEFEPRFTMSHTRLIPHLDSVDGIKPIDLARRLGSSKQLINQQLRDLEDMGIIQRVPDPDDGRGRLVIYTEAGEEFLSQGLGVLKDLESKLVDALSSEEIENMKDQLRQVLSVLEEH